MSSLRNAVKRIAHKERSQPVSRQHLGILEKKKDYKKRAQDYHRKEDAITAIREKASARNPDEFYFGMNSTQLQGGKHVTNTESRDLPADVIRLMKDQDLNYIRLQKQRDAKKVERLQRSLHYIEQENPQSSERNSHTIFVDDPEQAANFNVADHFQTTEEASKRTYNRSRKEESTTTQQEPDMQKPKNISDKKAKKLKMLEANQMKRAKKAKKRAYAELEARKKRVADMELAEAHLVAEQQMGAKGRKRKIQAASDGKPAQYKWRRKRST